MKRALSLIIVLAMVLCMIPFSSFAADFGIAGDFVDGVITLPANEEVTYLYTATEDGTVEVFAEAVVPEVAEGEEVPALAQPYIKIDGADYTEAFAVTAGQSYEITFYDDAMIGGDVNVYAVFKGLPGTETNPYEIYNPASGMGDGNTTTVAVEPNTSVYYNLYNYAGSEVTFTGNGVKISALGQTIDGTEAGYVTMTFGANDRFVLVKFTNKAAEAATYTITAVAPNSNTNPEVVFDGEYTANLTAGDDGYYYAYTAEGDGTVTITVNAADAEGNAVGWMFQANNVTAGTYGDIQFSDVEPVVNTVAVSAGDVVELMVNTYNPADMWGNPAATVTTTFAFEEVTEEPPVVEPTIIAIESLPYTHAEAFSGEYSQEFSYTNNTEETFYLFVKADNGGQASTNPWWGMKEYNGGIVYQLEPGASVTVMAYSYDSEMPANVYTFDKITEIEPDGSQDFPYAWGSLLNGPVSHNNDGDTTVFYVYEVEEDGKIYHGQWDSVYTMGAGETLNVSIEPGETVELYYIYPVAELNGVEYYTVAEALADAVSGDTVTMLADSHEESANLIIDEGVTLNIGAHNLYAKGVIAFTGGQLLIDEYRTSIAYGSLYVSSESRLVLTDSVVESDGSTSNVNLLPSWDSANNRYVFAGFMLQKVRYDYFMNDTDISFKFRVAYRGDAKSAFFTDGLADNGLKIVIRLTWKSGDHLAQQDFVYSDDFAKQSANATVNFVFGLSGYPAMYINREDLTITPMVVSDTGVELTGVTVYGPEMPTE